MGMQFVILARDVERMRHTLNMYNLTNEVEIFPLNTDHYGLSIPGKVIDASEENNIIKVFAEFKHFDLYDGIWRGGEESHNHSIGRRFLSALKSLF